MTDLSNKPLVSVVIPVYNGSNYLAQAIESALAQTWPNLEILVVDDGSDDEGRTEAVAAAYGDRIRYLKKPNGGVATALNYGIRAMRSEYFSWLSHDDRFEPNKIDRMMRAMLSRRETVVAFGDYVSTDKDGVFVREYRAGDDFNERQPLWSVFEGRINGCAMIVPKQCFDVCGLFDPRLPSTQDYDMWFRLALRFPFVHVPGVAVFQREHASQGSRTERFMEEVQLLWMSMLDRLPREVIVAHASSKAAFFERVSRWVTHLRGVCSNLLERMHPDVPVAVGAIVLPPVSASESIAGALKLAEDGLTHIIFPRRGTDTWSGITVDYEDRSSIDIDSVAVPSRASSVADVGVLASRVSEEFAWITTRVNRAASAIVPSQVALLADDPSAVACLVTDFHQGLHSDELGVLEGAVIRADAIRHACPTSTGSITSLVHALSRIGPIVSKLAPLPLLVASECSKSPEGSLTGESDTTEQFTGPAPVFSPGVVMQAWALLNRWPRVARVVTRTVWILMGGDANASQRLLMWNGLAGAVDRDWYRSTYSDVATNGIDPVLHYLLYGYSERRDPAPNFNTSLYLADNPDVDRPEIHPLQHYVLWGHKEGRRVQPALQMPSSLPDSTTDGRPAILIVLYGGRHDARLFARDLSAQVARRLRPIILTITSPDQAVLRSFEPEYVSRPFPLSRALNFLVEQSVRSDVRRIAVVHDGGKDDGSVRSLIERVQCPFDVVQLDYGLACGNPRIVDEHGRFTGDANLPDAIWRDDYERRWLIDNAAQHFASSRSLADRLARLGVTREIIVAPPPDPFRIRAYKVWSRPMDAANPLRIALFGRLDLEEGREVVEEVVRRVRQRKLNIRFRLYGQDAAGLESSSIFEVVRYSSLVDAVCSWHPHLAWYPSQAPDESGYSFSAAEAMGLPIAASSIGVATERLASRPLSWLLPWNCDADRWLELFANLHRGGISEAEDRMPEALPDDHNLYQRFYWRVVSEDRGGSRGDEACVGIGT